MTAPLPRGFVRLTALNDTPVLLPAARCAVSSLSGHVEIGVCGEPGQLAEKGPSPWSVRESFDDVQRALVAALGAQDQTDFCGTPSRDWLALFHDFGGPAEIRARLNQQGGGNASDGRPSDRVAVTGEASSSREHAGWTPAPAAASFYVGQRVRIDLRGGDHVEGRVRFDDGVNDPTVLVDGYEASNTFRRDKLKPIPPASTDTREFEDGVNETAQEAFSVDDGVTQLAARCLRSERALKDTTEHNEANLRALTRVQNALKAETAERDQLRAEVASLKTQLANMTAAAEVAAKAHDELRAKLDVERFACNQARAYFHEKGYPLSVNDNSHVGLWCRAYDARRAEEAKAGGA